MFRRSYMNYIFCESAAKKGAINLDGVRCICSPRI